MQRLVSLGCPTGWPRQDVSAFAIPEDLLVNTAVFLAGSPANHDPDSNRIEGQPMTNNVDFKSQVFYSMCWSTPSDSVVAMTWSLSACRPHLEWWTDRSDRVLMVAPAFFRSYQPRMGIAGSDATLSDESDTMISLYVPPKMMPCLRWVKDGKIDAAATIAQFMHSPDGRLVTFGAYTAELELDVVSAAA